MKALEIRSLRAAGPVDEPLVPAPRRAFSDRTLLLIKGAVAAAVVLAIAGREILARPWSQPRPRPRFAAGEVFREDFSGSAKGWFFEADARVERGVLAVSGPRFPGHRVRLNRLGVAIRQGERYRLSLRCWTPRPAVAVVRVEIGDYGDDPDGDGSRFSPYMQGVELHPSADDSKVYAFEFFSSRPSTSGARLAIDLVGPSWFSVDDVVLARIPSRSR